MAGAGAPTRGSRRGAGEDVRLMAELPDAPVFAYTLVEHVADHVGDDRADAYIGEVVDELLALEPGLRQHVSDLVIGDLKEEIARDDTEFAAACRNAIVNVENRWRNERG